MQRKYYTNQLWDQNEYIGCMSNGERCIIRDDTIPVKLPVPLKSECRVADDFEVNSELYYSIIVAQVRYYQIKGEFEQAKTENERWRETWWMEHQRWRRENSKWRMDQGDWCAQQKKRWMDNEFRWVEQNKKMKQLWVKLQELHLRMDQAKNQMPDQFK